MVFRDTKPLINPLPFYKVSQTRSSHTTFDLTMTTSSLAHLPSVTCHGGLVASLSTGGRIHLRTGHVGCMAEREVLGLVYQAAIWYSIWLSFHKCYIHIHIYIYSFFKRWTRFFWELCFTHTNTHTHTHKPVCEQEDDTVL